MHVSVARHPIFRRSSLDVIVRLPLTVEEARGGTELEVPTLRGVRRVRIPPGADTGKRIRLTGQGIRLKNGERGDLVLESLVRDHAAPAGTQHWPREDFRDTVAQIRRLAGRR